MDEDVLVFGGCMNCGAADVRLENVVNTIDLSAVGRDSEYCIGDGCENCNELKPLPKEN